MASSITRCISCGGDKLTKKRGPFPAVVHSKTVKIPGIEYYVCSRCGETFLDLNNEAKIDLYLERHQTEVVASGTS